MMWVLFLSGLALASSMQLHKTESGFELELAAGDLDQEIEKRACYKDQVRNCASFMDKCSHPQIAHYCCKSCASGGSGGGGGNGGGSGGGGGGGGGCQDRATNCHEMSSYCSHSSVKDACCSTCGGGGGGSGSGSGSGSGGNDGNGGTGGGSQPVVDFDDIPKIEAGTCGTPKAASKSDISSFIVGGEEAIPHSIPWQVSVQKPSGFHFCGASIVNEHFIMTAAHCVRPGDRINVVLGAHSKKNWSNEGGKSYTVSKIHKHKQYNSRTMHNDIALLYVAVEMKFNENAMPVCMPEKNYEWTKGDPLMVSGWGTLRSNGKTSPDLMHVTVPLYDHEKCARENGRTQIWEHVICAGLNEGGKDSCQGDSGGPIVGDVNGKSTLAGIVSWGVGCARAGKPGVYTKMSHYIDWMNQIMA